MTHDSPDPHGDGHMGSEPSQAVFIGWVAVGLAVFMALFALMVLIGAGSYSFS